MLRRFSCGHPSHNSVHTRPAFALSFQEQFLLVRHMTQSRAERGAGDKHTSSFTCSPASQGATLLSSERTRISFELGFFDTIIQRSRLTALLDSTPFSSSSLTATSWCFERECWAEGHRVEPSGHVPCEYPMRKGEHLMSTKENAKVNPGPVQFRWRSLLGVSVGQFLLFGILVNIVPALLGWYRFRSISTGLPGQARWWSATRRMPH